MNVKILSLILIMLFCPNLAYSQDTGSIYDTVSERIGHYQKEDNRIEVFDKSWERRGYIKLNKEGPDYFNQGYERINPDKLLRELKK